MTTQSDTNPVLHKAGHHHDAGHIDRLDFADRAEILLRRILAALGYENGDRLTALDVLTGITAWLELLLTMKRDPSGGFARVWWDAFKVLWDDYSTSEAAEKADDAVDQFTRRFPPFLEEERPTYDEGDLAAMRAELDRQMIINEGLQSDYDKQVLRINELHRSCAQLRENQAAAITERDELKAQLKEQSELLGANLQSADHTIKTMSLRIVELETQLASAIVPLPKPERVEPGQRWALVATAGDVANASAPWRRTWYLSDGLGRFALQIPDDMGCLKTSMHYLGTEK